MEQCVGDADCPTAPPPPPRRPGRDRRGSWSCARHPSPTMAPTPTNAPSTKAAKKADEGVAEPQPSGGEADHPGQPHVAEAHPPRDRQVDEKEARRRPPPRRWRRAPAIPTGRRRPRRPRTRAPARPACEYTRRLGMIWRSRSTALMATHRQPEDGVGGQHDVVADAGREGAEHHRARRTPEHRRSPRMRDALATGPAPAPQEQRVGHGHEAPAAVRRGTRRTAPPGSIEGPALPQPLDDDLELAAEDKPGGRADPRDEGVHVGTLTDGLCVSADARAVPRARAGGCERYFLAGS